MNAGYELSTEIVLTKPVANSPAPSGVAIFQRLGAGSGVGAGGGNSDGGGGGHISGGGGGQPDMLPQHQVLTITTRSSASPFCSMKHSGQDAFPSQTESLGEKAQLFGKVKILEWISVVVGLTQEIS